MVGVAINALLGADVVSLDPGFDDVLGVGEDPGHDAGQPSGSKHPGCVGFMSSVIKYQNFSSKTVANVSKSFGFSFLIFLKFKVCLLFYIIILSCFGLLVKVISQLFDDFDRYLRYIFSKDQGNNCFCVLHRVQTKNLIKIVAQNCKCTHYQCTSSSCFQMLYLM